MTRFVLLAVFVVLTSSVDAEAAKSEPSFKAEGLIREGIELRRISDDQSALPKFEGAVQIDPTPRAVAQLGLCELAVGRFSRAVEHLTLAMRASKDKWVASNKAVLRESLEEAKARVGRIEIIAEPAGAEVLINGELIGVAPLRDVVVTNEGAADVQVRFHGFTPQTRALTIKGGQHQKVAFQLERPAAVLVPTAAHSSDSASLDAHASLQEKPSGAQPGWLAPTKWTVLGVAGLGFAVGTYGWINHQSLVASFDRAGCQVDRQGDPGFVADTNAFTVSEDCTRRFGKIDDATKLRTVGFIAGGAFLAAYAVLSLLYWERSQGPGEVPTAQVSCGFGLSSVGCAGNF